jgi:hypothetical protein
VDLQINFQWYIWPPFPDMPQLFSARWTGVLVADVTVNATIAVTYDFGGARYTFHGSLPFALVPTTTHRACAVCVCVCVCVVSGLAQA